MLKKWLCTVFLATCFQSQASHGSEMVLHYDRPPKLIDLHLQPGQTVLIDGSLQSHAVASRVAQRQSNSALEPVPWLEKDSYDWDRRHLEALAAKSMNPEIVLIGDSITHFWGGLPKASHATGPKAWEEAFGNKRVLNLGFGWDRTQNVLWRLDHDELRGLKPKIVVLNIGTNNLSGTSHARANSPEEIAAAIVAIADEIHDQTPSSHILVMGIFPRGFLPSDPRRAMIQQTNALVQAALVGKQGMSLLDIGPQFLLSDGTLPREMMSDGTHPTEQGYHVWAQALLAAHVRSERTSY